MVTHKIAGLAHATTRASQSAKAIVVATLLASLVTGVAFTRWPEIVVIGVGAATALLLCVLAPKAAMVVVVLWMLFQYMPTDIFPILPRSSVWIDDGLLVLLTMIWMARRLANKEGFRPSWFDIVLVAFVLTGLISTVTNAAPIAITLQGIRGPVQPILVYYVILNMGFSKNYLRFLVLLVISVAVVQCAYTILNGLAGGGWWGDYVSGIFGKLQGTGFGHWQSLVVLVVIGLILFDRDARMVWAVIGLLIALPLVLASSRISYFVIPFSIFWPLRHRVVKNMRTSFLVIGIIALVFLGVNLSYGLTQGRTVFQENMNPSYILESQLLANYGGRLLWYQTSWELISRSLSTLLLGFGPGMFTSFTSERNLTPMFLAIESIKTNQRFVILPNSELISIPGEFGFIGLALYVTLLAISYRRMIQVFQNIEWPFWKGVAFGVSSCVIYYVFAGLTGNTWETTFVAGTFWLLVGIVTAMSRQASSSVQDTGA